MLQLITEIIKMERINKSNSNAKMQRPSGLINVEESTRAFRWLP
jgi:hypothetical protein